MASLPLAKIHCCSVSNKTKQNNTKKQKQIKTKTKQKKNPFRIYKSGDQVLMAHLYMYEAAIALLCASVPPSVP